MNRRYPPPPHGPHPTQKNNNKKRNVEQLLFEPFDELTLSRRKCIIGLFPDLLNWLSTKMSELKKFYETS
jgi:hypothetical protein